MEHCQFCRFDTVRALSCALVPPIVIALHPAPADVSYMVPRLVKVPNGWRSETACGVTVSGWKYCAAGGGGGLRQHVARILLISSLSLVGKSGGSSGGDLAE